MRHLTRALLGTQVLLAVIMHISTVPAKGQERFFAKNQDARIMEISDEPNADTRALVEALANRNAAPAFAGRWHYPAFDERYDWREYQRVWSAIGALLRHAEHAWPDMVNHLDDDRYCITLLETDSDYTYNWTVGDMCRAVIADNLSEAYYRNLKPGLQIVWARLRTPGIARDKKTLKAWCEERRNKRLYELQIEMCHWAITELQKRDIPRVSDLRSKAWEAAIEAEIESLRDSEMPVVFRGFGEQYTLYSPDKAERSREMYLKEKEEERKKGEEEEKAKVKSGDAD